MPTGVFCSIFENVCNVSPLNSISFGGIIFMLTSVMSISFERTSTLIGNSAFVKIDSGVIVWIVTPGSSFIVIGIAMSWKNGSCGV